jgi:hypothetical protein
LVIGADEPLKVTPSITLYSPPVPPSPPDIVPRLTSPLVSGV